MALTVRKLKEILNTLDSDAPVVIENDREQYYLKEKMSMLKNFMTIQEIVLNNFKQS